MNALFILIEVALQIFASWTLAYHLALLTRLPARLIIIPFLVILFFVIALFRSNRKYTIYQFKREKGFLLGVAALALAMGGFTLFNSRSNADDFSFFYRPLTQLQFLASPFFITDTSHNVSGLPALSVLHAMTSYEPLVVMTAAMLGFDPLTLYQNVSAFLSAIILTVVYVLIYRQFQLKRRYALIATLGVFLFLLADGNLVRSFGNFSLVRLWQGKTILCAVLVPITLLMAYRFMNRPTTHRFSLAAMTSICAVGLSGSGVFLIPCLILGVSLAYLLSYGFSRVHVRRALFLNFASFYCVGIAAILVSGLISEPVNTSVWNEGWPLTWWQNLGLVIGDNAALTRDLLILVIVPLIGLTKPLNRFPVFLSLCLCLIFANPLTGPFWMDKIKPASYWRLAYLFPLPLCAGLVINSFSRRGLPNKSYWSRIALITMVVMSIAIAYRSSVLTPTQDQTPTYFKLPWEYKFSPQELAFARSSSDYLKNKNLLAPESIVVVLGLINPTIKFEAARPSETLHLFRNIGQEKEGLRRLTAQSLVTTCKHSAGADAAVLRSLETGVNAIITRDCDTGSFLALLNLGIVPGQWQEVEHNNGYILLLRRQ